MSNETPLARRQFLKKLAAGTVATGAAAAVAPAAAASTEPSAQLDARKGYQESEHVRRYYASARGQE